MCAALSACGAGSGTDSADQLEDATPDASAIEVPDVSLEDGAGAVSAVEDAGLQATLSDANDDPGFDSSRDATDCEVTDQDPAAGESVQEGDEVIIRVDCSQVDWSNQEGSAWDAFNDAYLSSFEDGCQALFDQSPDGALYENDVEYTVTDCENESPSDASDASDVPGDAPDDPEAAGSELGELDGCQALFENQGVFSLNYGADSITEDDCPVASAASAPPSDRKPKTPKSHSSSVPRGYKRCDANIAAKAGTTSCGFAENVFYEFWSQGEPPSLRVYSPATRKAHELACAVEAGDVTCATADGGAVRFAQAAVDAYSQDQADDYAATHDLGP
jgi:PASTA domain